MTDITGKLRSDGEGTGGFSLVELMISMAVLGIAFFTMFTFFISQHKVVSTNQRNFTQQQQAVFLLDTLVKDIRRAGYFHKGEGSGADQDVKIAESRKIKFYVDTSSSVQYEYDAGTEKMYQFNDTFPAGRVIFDELNITTLSFRYYNAGGTTLSNPVATTLDLRSIRRVDIYMEVKPLSSASASVGMTHAMPFNASVKPRNLGLYEE